MREILSLLPKPSQYLGIEENAVCLQPGALRLHCALAFPDLYEVGMSYLGQKILYDLLNDLPGVGAERVFAPSREAAELLREHKVPLATLESDTNLAATHFLGFSLTHELAFTNVLYMLDLAGIPLRQSARGQDLKAWPLVVAGGGCTLCAEPLAPFMDIMVLGEGEAVLPALVELLIQAREADWTRSAFLEQARHIPGVYVPSLFVAQKEGGVKALFDDYTVVRRRPVADMADAKYPSAQVTPFGAVHNRLSLEIARGCTRGCRFCQAGMTTRPSRERSLEDIHEILEECLARTGYEDVSFLSLSCGDFSGLKTLFLAAAERCAEEQISLSLPSLRVGSVDADIMGRMAGIRRTGATLAPEAGSQRLRDVINKGVTEEGLMYHVRQLVGHGWQQVKLYFMIGLPSETYEDLDAIVDLCLKVRDIARVRDENGTWRGPRLMVSAALSPFVPKTHTPFQWEAQISLEEMQGRIRHVREAMRPHKNLKLHWHEPAMSHLEGILSRGDRSLADVVEKAYAKGGIFSSWVENFDLAPWREAMAECGLDSADYTGPRSLNAPLPWDHLEAGVSQRFLQVERERALRGAITDDCRYAPCRHCGVCDTKAGPSLLHSPTGEPEPRLSNRLIFPERDQQDRSPLVPIAPYVQGGRRAAPPSMDAQLTHKAVRYRIWHKKDGQAAYISQLDLQSILERAMRRACLPLSFSQGFHPLPQLSFGRALPVSVRSQCEWFAITLREPWTIQKVQEKLGPCMLRGLELLRVEALPLHGKVPPTAEELFSVRYPDMEPDAVCAAWENFAAHKEYLLTRLNKKNEEKSENIRSLLNDWEFDRSAIRFTLNWRNTYLSPLTFVRTIVPAASPASLELTKLAQFF